MKALVSLCLLALLVSGNGLAAEKKSSKVIDFEGEVVEGVNKRSLDSLNQVSEEERRRKRPHLYMKRKTFLNEDRALIRELRMY